MIHTHPNLDHENKVIGVTIEVDKESFALFQQLVARACNTWDTVHPSIKVFHDEIVNGHVLQDYDALNVR